jgi:hypothetical protein
MLKPIFCMPSIIAAGGAAAATSPLTWWSMPRFISSGALISIWCTTGAPQ